ncbi:LppM family (lipo)protein [Natrinema halophilum]|uniref:LppM domain-containing protein n=1 Tax=Natrinema halophilum TaxID=1699371 RepID=A0A7D5KYE9_9EURY|nr:hypothetical protein [Natrinema halophilum]QLG50622.1 hypothetical protein HYG82_18160 [Natrinema halophilum]
MREKKIIVPICVVIVVAGIAAVPLSAVAQDGPPAGEAQLFESMKTEYVVTADGEFKTVEIEYELDAETYELMKIGVRSNGYDNVSAAIAANFSEKGEEIVKAEDKRIEGGYVIEIGFGTADPSHYDWNVTTTGDTIAAHKDTPFDPAAVGGLDEYETVVHMPTEIAQTNGEVSNGTTVTWNFSDGPPDNLSVKSAIESDADSGSDTGGDSNSSNSSSDDANDRIPGFGIIGAIAGIATLLALGQRRQ